MGDFFRKLVAWIKEHPYMAAGVAIGGVALYVLYSRSQAAAASAASQSASQTATTGGPSDTIQAMQIQADAQLQVAQISAQAQEAQYAAQLQATQLQLQAQQEANNGQNQAALTLGLAQAGDSTSSILQLLGAQPGATPVQPTTVVPTVTQVTTPPASTPSPTPAPTNPAPTNPAPTPAIAPAAAQAASTVATVPSMVSVPATAATIAAPPVAVAAPVATSTTTTGAPVPLPAQPPGAGQIVTSSGGVEYSGAEGALDPAIYEQHVTGTEAPTDTSYGVNNTYYATPQATADLSSILGTQSVVAPSVVGASGGPFYNPPTEDIITPDGTVNAGQMLSELQNLPPALWGTILGGYGIQNTPDITNQIYNMFGTDQAVPAGGN